MEILRELCELYREYWADNSRTGHHAPDLRVVITVHFRGPKPSPSGEAKDR